MLRKIAQVLTVLMLLSFTIDGLSQSQQAYRDMMDFSFATKDRRTLDEKSEDFLIALKRGDRRAFQIVNYDVLLAVIVRLKKEADEALKTKPATEVGYLKPLMWQMGAPPTIKDDENNEDFKRIRNNLVQATIPGIFNLDPRVRLAAASWLRNLRPDPSMMRAVKMAVGVDVQVIRYNRETDDFVFTAPRILETVSSWQEYYREKDLDYPSVFSPGAVETLAVTGGNGTSRIGGQGVNNERRVGNKFNADDAGDKNYVVTGLDARRWGSPTVYDNDRKWEKQLQKTGGAKLGAGGVVGGSAPPQSQADYYQRLNAAINIANKGLSPNDKLPDGRNFSMDIYSGDAAAKKKAMDEDMTESNRQSISTRFPGHTLVPKYIAAISTQKDPNTATNDELEALPENRDVYRYYPNMRRDAGNASLNNLPADQREKMELLLHQNWQQGTRVPIGQGRMYVYVNAFGEIVVGNPWVELTKLDMFITRHVWYKKLKEGNLNTLAVMSKDTFATLWMSIDGETPDVIPFLSTPVSTQRDTNTATTTTSTYKPMLDYKDIPVLLEGLRRNKVVSNRYVIARAIKDIYEHAETPATVKRQINIALWEEKRDTMRHDLEVGKLFHREMITVGKAPARPQYTPPLAGAAGMGAAGANMEVATDLDPYSPVGVAGPARVDRKVDLGFAQPNDEILANSNRVIVSNVDFVDNRTNTLLANRVDSKVAYDLDKLYKQRFYLLVGPDGVKRDYYQHRQEYSRLWRDGSVNMPVMLSDTTVGQGATQYPPLAGDKAKLAVNPDIRPVEPTTGAADVLGGTQFPNLLATGLAQNRRNSAAAQVTENVSFWEASRYIDSLVIYNIDRMAKAQGLINDIINGNGRSFLEARWEDLESAVVLTLKRLETLHRMQGKTWNNCEDPTRVRDGVAPNAKDDGCLVKPELTFFDGFVTLNLDSVIRNNSTTDPAISRTVAGLDGVARSVQVRREKEFVPIAEQVANITGNTYSEEKRNNIIQASLGGLFNKDPRVRLTAIHFLRSLGPDETMLEDVNKARNISAQTSSTDKSAETNDYRSAFIDTHVYRRNGQESPDVTAIADYLVLDKHKYEGAMDRDVDERAKGLKFYETFVAGQPSTAKYKQSIPHPNYKPEVNEFSRVLMLPTETATADPRPMRFYGFYQLKAPAEELEKLYKMIRRKQLVRAIKAGDVKSVQNLSRSEFTVLSEAVDNEWRGYVPFQSFHSLTADPEKRLPSRLAIFDGRDVKVIKEGYGNKNFLVQKGTAEFLIRFYNFYDKCTDFRTRATLANCNDGVGYEPNGTYKTEIRQAMYYYIQSDIVVPEFELAFNGENPDGRAVIRAGSDLSMHLNPGGERVYLSLPERIRKDIRDAVWGDYERLPEELKNILGIISTRAPRPNVLTYYNVMLGLEPRIPLGDAGDQLRD